MPTPEEIYNYFNDIYRYIFHTNLPAWLSTTVGIALAIAFGLCGLWGILTVLSKIKDTWSKSFQPLFYNKEEKQRSERRQRFARYIEHRIISINDQEEWGDYRFAELEAEIETEGLRSTLSLIPFLKQTRSGPRREKSLSKALMKSAEPIVLLEGEPGSGKSVALRHLAQKMAEQAIKMRSTKSIIPIYVNLKLLEREAGEVINQELIRSFVLKSTHRNDRNIEKYLDDEFQTSIQDGTWFFLFDSFDELPEVLSSTEADDKIREYRRAIDDFLHGMGRCRGIVASRPYRGPTGFGWPRFRVLPLTEARQLELIKKAHLDSQLYYEIVGQLGNAKEDIHSMASNPFYLTLLYKHIEGGKPFPENAYTVFATYVEEKFSDDEKHLKRLYQSDAAIVQTAAEHIAFCMTASPGLGLNPTRTNLKIAMENLGIYIGKNFEILLDALEFMRLARPDVTTNAAQSRSFTFAHRRFQEYFATRAVLQETSRVSSHKLLTDAQWRETAVVLCQTGTKEILMPLLEEVDHLLVQYINTIPDGFLVPISVSDKTDTILADLLRKGLDTTGTLQEELESFPWPLGLLHLLDLLQDGFTNRLADLPDTIRQYVGKLVISASHRGILPDKKWALEVSSTAPDAVLVDLLKDTFSKSKSQWLKEVAYQQVARLHTIPSEVAQGILNALVELAATKRLRQQRYATQTYLTRIHQPTDFLATMQLLLRLPIIDLGLHILLFMFIIFSGDLMGIVVRDNQSLIIVTSAAILLGIGLYISHNLLILFMGPLHNLKKNILAIVGGTARIVLIYILIIVLISFLVLSGSTIYWNQSLLICLLIVIVYVALFGPFAFRAAQTGNFVRPGLWIFLPIWPLLFLITHPIFLFKKFLTSLGFILLGGLGIAILALLINLSEMHNSSPLGSIVSTASVVLLWALLIVYVAFGIGTNFYILFLIIKSLLLRIIWAYERVRWSRKSHKLPKSITSQEFLNLLISYHNITVRTYIVKTIRKKHLLHPTQETEETLTQMIRFIETAQQRKEHIKKKKSRAPDLYIPLSEKSQMAKRINRFILEANAELLDEISRLLEDVRTQVEQGTLPNA